MAISPARIAAYEVLLRVERDHGYSSILLPQFEAGLTEKDRSLCHAIVLGVLRRKFFLDHLISQFSGSKKIDVEVMSSLRIGAFQLIFLDRVPDHPAVNESVGLVQRAKKSSAKGFVNAILRKVAGAEKAPSLGDGIDRVSIETSHPQWLLKRWVEQFGEGRAFSIAVANNIEPTLSFRLTKCGLGRGFSAPDGASPSEIVERGYTIGRLSAELKNAAERGEIYFQDQASQLVARSVSIPKGGRFLDVCAAPGGKTTLIAANADATIVAGDLFQPRIEFLRANAIKQGVPEIGVIRYDAESSLPFADDGFDTILVDAPCSGTGTIRNNPEIRYFLKPEDLQELPSKQLTILNNASKLLKQGGRLYYSTCSFEREENEGVIEAFLASVVGFSIDRSSIDPRFRTPDGFTRTFPDRDGTDGFFMAALQRD